MKDLTQIERGKTISFFNKLDTEKRTMLVTYVSFFNEVATETKKLSSEVVSFFNELEIRKLCSSLVSFFNKLEIRKSCSRTSVSFLMRLPQRNKNYPQKWFLDHRFQEDNASK
jgi:hypothetical protein